MLHLDYEQAFALSGNNHNQLSWEQDKPWRTVHYQMDYLLTWNCRHLAHEVLQRRLVKLNESLKLMTPLIVTPEELFAFSEEEI